jgi:hypothetical protein
MCGMNLRVNEKEDGKHKVFYLLACNAFESVDS